MAETIPHPLEEVCKRLKNENRVYRNNFEDLKEAYQAQSEEIETLTAKLQLVFSEKKNILEDHDQLVQDWRKQLDIKSREFDEMRKALVQQPFKDVDIIKMECLAEFQEMSNQKWNIVEADVQKWRNLYFTVQKDYEVFKIGIQDKEKHYQAALEDLASAHFEEITTLQMHISDKNDALQQTSSLSTRIYEVQRENGDLSLKCKALLDEMQDVRALMATQQATSQQQVQNLQRQLHEKDQLWKNAISDRDIAKQHQIKLEDSTRKLAKEHEDLREENSKLRLEVAKVRSQFEEAMHNVSSERSDTALKSLKERTKLEQEILKLKQTIDEKTHRETDLNVVISELQKRHLEQEQTFTVKLNSMREETGFQVRVAEDKCSELEKNLAIQVSAYEALQRDVQREKDFHQQDKDMILNENSGLRQGTVVLKASLEKLQNDHADLKILAEDLKTRLLSTEQQLSKQHSSNNLLLKKEDEHQQKFKKLQETFQDLQRELMDLQEQRRHETRESELQREDLQLKIAAGVRDIEKDQEELAKLKGQIETLVETIKKLKNGYKAKLDAQKQVNEQLEDENEGLRKSLENENHQAQLRLREMFRKQEEFANFLQGEGVLPKKVVQ